MKFLKKYFSIILLAIVMIIGFGIMVYPYVSNYWNLAHQSKIITSYNQAVGNLDEAGYQEALEQAREYNQSLIKHNDRFLWEQYGDVWENYNEILNIAGNGSMGYVEIPKIGVKLPLYHGTDANVLQVAVGHVYGSSFPVGGNGTHAVLSGHSGLPKAALFTDLGELELGDIFTIRVLNELLTYQVDAINIVLPDDTSLLQIDSEQDYCTLVTCTPYGVNSHRLLVRGTRIENLPEDEIKLQDEISTGHKITLSSLDVIYLSLFGVIVLVILGLFVSHKITKRRGKM